MEPLHLLAAAGAFLGAEAAKKLGGMMVESAFKTLKKILQAGDGNGDVSDCVTPEAIEKLRPEIRSAYAEQVRGVLARSSALRRAELVRRVLVGASVLWVDDHPENNAYEQRVLGAFGVRSESVMTTGKALENVRQGRYDVIVSDMARSRKDSGLNLLRSLRQAGNETALVFYIGKLNPEKGVPKDTFGIADRPEELLHLVLDVLERHRV